MSDQTQTSPALALTRAPRLSGTTRRAIGRELEGLAFISPAILGLIIFTAGPMVASLWFSLTRYDLITPPKWIGLENYARLIKDQYVGVSLWNTAYYTFIGVPLQTVVALLQALLLNVKVRGVNGFRTLFYLPSVTPAVASIILWLYIFNQTYGLINASLWTLGIHPIGWLVDPKIVKMSFIIMSLWNVGGRMVIFLAALQGVPDELYESASLDGANAWHRVWHITLPMISPVVFFNIIMGFIGSFQVFAAAFIATDGGPANATLFYVLYLYRMAFENLKMGFASALAWVLFLIIVLFTALQFAGSRRWVYYEAA
jgi:multiple sugar transport system permease protein